MTAQNDDAEQNTTGQHQDEAAKKFARMRQPRTKGDPRRQHLIPKFYLANFAKDEQLIRIRFSEPTKRTLHNINDLAVIKDFYTVFDYEVGPTVAIEHLLGAVDSVAKKPLDILTRGVPLPLPKKLKHEFAIWLSLLSMRGTYPRRLNEALADDIMKQKLSLITDEETARTHLRGKDGSEAEPETVQAMLDLSKEMKNWENIWDKDIFTPHQNESIETMLEDTLDFVPYFLNRLWTVHKFPSPGLVTSDKPVICFKSCWNPSTNGVGIANADEIWLPLDRSTLLVLHSYDKLHKDLVRLKTSETLSATNQVIVSEAYNEVYCHPLDIAHIADLQFPPHDRPIVIEPGAYWLQGQTDGLNRPTHRRNPLRYEQPEP